jgi:hypothetical protein
MPGKTEAALALLSEDDTSATFEATFEGHKNDNPYELWVTVNGYDADGVHRSQSNAGLRWNELDPVPVGTTCEATLPKNIDPAHPSLTYSAYVWDHNGNPSTPVSNTVAFS